MKDVPYRILGTPRFGGILIVSDHGFGPLPEPFVKVSVDLDKMLAHLGLRLPKGPREIAKGVPKPGG